MPACRPAQVKGADRKRQLTDLVIAGALRAGAGHAELKPFADEVDKRFQAWIFRHNAQRATAFTPEQTEWLRLMKDHIASSCSMATNWSRELVAISTTPRWRPGRAAEGVGEVLGLRRPAWMGLMDEMNEELVA
jgi:type I restriction enzyme R subunit